MSAEEAVKEAHESPQAEAKRERVHSSIAFPYSDLDDAVGVAKSVYTIGGSSCQADQLAARLGLSVSASMFQLRLNTARIFGLIVYSQGTVTLTSLGTRVCDRQQEAAARAESFLSVPLYKAVYEQFKGATLPPPGGLDTTIGNMGVSPKQKEKARRVFQRSAQQAGFFAFGQDRLVSPSKGGGEPVPLANGETLPEKMDGKKDPHGGDGGEGRNGTRHPLIEGLIKALPDGGADWPLESRKKWLQAAAMNFAFVYTDSKRDSTEDQESLKVSIERESSAK